MRRRQDAPLAGAFLNVDCQCLLRNCQKTAGARTGGVREWGVRAAMHEVSIMTEALRAAEDAVRTAGAARVTGMRLRVGTLSSAVPEAMRFAWDVVRRDTLADGASLEIEIVPAACWCATCRAEFVCEDFVNECPACHNLSGELRRGRELQIAAVELE